MILAALPAPLTAATSLRLYATAERTGDPIILPVTTQGSRWVIDTGTITGRRWPTIVGTTSAGTSASAMLAPVDLPDDDTLVVSPEVVAVKARMSLPLTAEQRETIRDAILDAQADVDAYLGQSPLPAVYTQAGAYPWVSGWRLTAHGDAPVLRVLSTVAETYDGGALTGTFTVTYLAGIDAKHDPALRPIRRFVTAHAMNSPEVTNLWKIATGTQGEIRSVSAEGQSVSWAPATLGGGGAAGSLAPGALPTMESLDRWRVRGRRVYQGRTRSSQWPSESMDPVAENRDWFERR